MKAELSKLFQVYTGYEPDTIQLIPRAVSTRKYFRIIGAGHSVIGTYSPDRKETAAFIHFSRIFRDLTFHVPEVFMVSDDMRLYLQQDLGNTTLHDLITGRPESSLSEDMKTYYRQAIDDLVVMQIEGDKRADYSLSVPRPAFDYQSVMWDLYHFKYYFLKPLGIAFDEEKLERSFKFLANAIESVEPKGFMFRDFQTRNIMVQDGEVYMIDYQGGRRGPVQYDLASLLFEARASLDDESRVEFSDYYYNAMESRGIACDELFINGFYLTAVIRVLQALGTYGLRGNLEKKAVFIQSIPTGLENLESLLKNHEIEGVDSYLREILEEMTGKRRDFRSLPDPFPGLTVTVYSFSYRKPLPDDLHGNGGGFVYDCRFLDNPGRFKEFRSANGLEKPVIDFLEAKSETNDFLNSVKLQLQNVADKYRAQKYTSLMVSFGCTGGQHRSVYIAGRVAEWLRDLEGVRVIEIHRELGISR